MIRIKKKAASAVPTILLSKGTALTKVLCDRYENGLTIFEFDSGVYGNEEVKKALIAIQDYKCCFCESKIGHIAYGDVEHFRPKAGWVQGNEKLSSPGYYWLAYEWDNLLLSCQICNQRHKKNYFPLLNPAGRALSHLNNHAVEQPVFIHPANENPEDFITFNEEIPVAVNDNARGIETINKLSLDRPLLNEQRREWMNMIQLIYNLANGYPDTNPEIKEKALAEVKKYYESSSLDSTEYAGMKRAFFRKNPV